MLTIFRAQYGTTKYCSAYLRGETCNNKSCTFLHETGEEGHGTTLQNEPSLPKAASRPAFTSQTFNAQITARPVQQSVQPPVASSQLMLRESSKDEAKDLSSSVDNSALPSTASWANKDTSTQATRSRRQSQNGGTSSTSPQTADATLSTRTTEENVRQLTTSSGHVPALPGPSTGSKPQPSVENQVSRPSSSGRTSPIPVATHTSLFDKLVTNVNSPGFRFSFDDKAFTDDELAAIERCPTMIDPYGGAKRRLMRDKEAERIRQQLDAQAKSQGRPTSTSAIVEEENVESGSLALGGEPEEGARHFSGGSAIQRPSQSSNASSSMNDQFSILGMNSRSLTPQQRQQLAMLSSANIQQASGLRQANQQSFGLGTFDEQRHNSLQNQQYDPAHGHARQSSRYSFANDSVKPNPAPRFPTQQQSGSTPQHFYPSGVQGPPPGLKTAGTPPISGGGMFAQGHGFTSNMNANFGAAKDANAEMLIRGRSGTGSGHDLSKREYQLSLQNNSYRSPPASAPAPGLLNSLYGPYSGTYQDPGLVKQKKKGKKHRHANTSSSGGGVVDLADPSTLQARLHQNTGGAGQGLFGGQHQGGYNQSNGVYGGGYNRW
jgi:CCR4-NOT transcription complex subunit 4